MISPTVSGTSSNMHPYITSLHSRTRSFWFEEPRGVLRGGDLTGLDDGLGRESHSRVCKGTEAACCRGNVGSGSSLLQEPKAGGAVGNKVGKVTSGKSLSPH